MRVLHLVGTAEDTGGILTVVRGLQTATAGRGWEHAVWVNEAFKETRKPALSYRRGRRLVSESPSQARLAWGAWRALGELRALLRKEPFDVLHAHSRGAMLLGLAVAGLWRRPVVYTSHGRGRRPGLYRWAARRPGFHLVLIAHEMARHYGLRERPPEVTVISSCCADDFFAAPLVTRSAAGRDGQVLRLAGVGDLVRWKNWDLVLQALDRMEAGERTRLEFSLWGPTPSEPDARRFATELRDYVAAHRLETQVHLRGQTNAIREVLREVDWLVHPTTNEPCGVAVIEALALGVPALVSASGGPSEIVTSGRTGLHFAPASVDDLAAKLTAIARGQVQVASPAELRESVRHRSATRTAEAYGEIYRAAVARQGRAMNETSAANIP